VLGCDIAGEIEQFGPETDSPLTTGQRVIVWWVCVLRCEQCLGGSPNTCAPELPLSGAHLWGGYAQYVKVRR